MPLRLNGDPNASPYVGLTALLFFLAAGFSVAATRSTTQTLSAEIDAIGKVSVPSSLSLTSTGTTFNAYTGHLTVSYRARTTASTGSGSLTVKATADFGPAGGPSIAAGHLKYTCSSASLGTACSGTQTTSVSAQTSVVGLSAGRCTGGGGSCSAADPNTVATDFTLANNPTFSTGTYFATLTFTISAL